MEYRRLFQQLKQLTLNIVEWDLMASLYSPKRGEGMDTTGGPQEISSRHLKEFT